MKVESMWVSNERIVKINYKTYLARWIKAIFFLFFNSTYFYSLIMQNQFTRQDDMENTMKACERANKQSLQKVFLIWLIRSWRLLCKFSFIPGWNCKKQGTAHNESKGHFLMESHSSCTNSFHNNKQTCFFFFFSFRHNGRYHSYVHYFCYHSYIHYSIPNTT